MTPFSPIKLKVCGMRDPANILEVAALQPDYLGFIFYRDSPRFVGDDFRIPDSLDPSIGRVGVFVDSSTADIVQQVNQHGLTHLQLHGSETPGQCGELKARGFAVIKAIGIDYNTEFDSLETYVPVVDSFLFDTKSTSLGGSGRQFDWNLLSRYRYAVPFILSGGIAPENVGQVANVTNQNLHAVDVNSGVESKPGVKNVAHILYLKKQLNLAMNKRETYTK